MKDTAAAVEFLQWFRPGGPWVLTSIVPDGKIRTNTFRDEKSAHDWIDAVNGTENLYFHVNSTGEATLFDKAQKKDIVAAEWLHVDVDPTTGMVAAERKKILEKLENHIPKPSLIIDSGGGYQAFWRLSDAITSDEGDWSDFERYNRQLESDLGGDHCHNVDRIMRLPGTVNVPNKKKRSKGREKRPASVVFLDNEIYDISVFSQAPALGGTDLGDPGRVKVEISGNLPRIGEIDDLDQWGKERLSDYHKMLIVQGCDPDNPAKYGSRSEVLWAVLCEMARCEFPDDVMAAVVLDRDLAISGHILDQKKPEASAIRQIQRAKEHAIDPELSRMNNEYCTVIQGGKFRIMRWIKDPTLDGLRVPEFMAKDAFELHHGNKKVVVAQTQEGLPITKKKGKWWLEHPQRRSYMGVRFLPNGTLPEDMLNLWQGFSYMPHAGDKHQMWLDHVFENICSGNREHYDYLIGWCARLVQNPASQSETAIVLRGGQGTGKNSFVETLGALMREHFFMAARSNAFLGNFNAHLRDKLLVYANEAFFAGDKQHEAALKMLITESMMPVEFKGVDISMESNFIHLIMGSNSEWVVPAGLDDRRFFVLDVGSGRQNDGAYFAQMKKLLRGGGYENLLHFLMNYDLSEFNIRKVPQTEALQEQKLLTMSPLQQWWYDRLCEGHGFDCWMPIEGLWQHYIQRMKDEHKSRHEGRVAWGRFMNTVVPNLTRKQKMEGGSRQYCYQMPGVDTCRDVFDKNFGGPYDWPVYDGEETREIPF